MKKIALLFLLLPFIFTAQVGVNTTTPKAALDIESSSNGVLIPRVQLTSTLDVTTVINPNSGPLETSTLVYNIATAGVAPNNVVAGFYYWNGSKWLAISANINDHDWYKVGTTSAPTDIADDMFHIGKVAIGKNTATSSLDIESNNDRNGIKNTINNNSVSLGNIVGIENSLSLNSNDPITAVSNNFYGTGIGSKIGIKNNSSSSILGDKTGVSNVFYGDYFDNLTGNSNTFTNVSSGKTIGTKNIFNATNFSSGIYGLSNSFTMSGGNGDSIGVINDLTSNSSGLFAGISNNLSSNNGGGSTYGILNNINGKKSGGKFGVMNYITTDINTPDNLYGIFNNISADTNSATSNSIIIGLNNNITANGNTDAIGNYNYITGTTTNNIQGVFSSLTNSGNGNHTGINSILSGSGTGTKYGCKITINDTAGGQHFGIHSTVLKSGNNFSGYFIGKVAIGQNTSVGIDDYILPLSRGANNNIMQTDGFGNVSWKSPTSALNSFAWLTKGNTAITEPAFPTTYGTSTFGTNENFIGTTDANDLVFGTNNIERMRIYRDNGQIKIGPTPVLGYNCAIDVYSTDKYVAGVFRGSASSNIGIVASAEGTSSSGVKIGGHFSATGGASNYAIIVPPNSGDIGFGTSTPSTKLHVVNPIAGAIRIEDGTQANGNVLRCNASGVGTWQNPNTFSWSLTGNTVNATTNFLGSTNDANVVFKRNNANAGYIGQYNTAFGINTLPITTGIYNTAVGVNALSGLGLADQNCAFGWNALSGVTTGGNNIGIGTNAQVPSATANNQVRIGNTNISYAGIQVAWSITSDRKWKANIQKTNLGLNFINQLNPVSYTRKNDEKQKTEYGFIAQELEETLTKNGATNNGIITKDDEGMLSVRYNDLIAPMVKAIQELTSENEKLKSDNASLVKRLEAIENKVNNLAKK